MTEVVEDETEEVLIANVALEAAAGTTTLAGTCAAAVSELVSATVAPLPSAGPLNVTVPCELLPANTLVGFTVTDATVGVACATVKEAVGVVPPKLADIVELMGEATADVVIAKVALVAAARTTTLAGTCTAAVLLLVKVTLAPPAGAGPLSVTVPCELVPPTTTFGFTVTDAIDTPFVVTAPTAIVGMVAAYWRLRA
jgi:hypothetical protein